MIQEDVWSKAGIAMGTYQAMESEKEFERGRMFEDYNLEAVAEVLGVLLPDIALLPGISGSKNGISDSLGGALDKLDRSHQERDKAIHTPHLLSAMLHARNSAIRNAINRHGDEDAIVYGLLEIIDKIEPKVAGYRPVEWSEHRYVRRALEYAYNRREPRQAYEADVSLAMIQRTTGKAISKTIDWVIRELGEESYARVRGELQIWEPTDYGDTTPPPD